MTHPAFLLFTCIFSIIFAGMIYFNYLARRGARSLLQIRVVLSCWLLLIACYAVSCQFPATTSVMHSLSSLFFVVGGANGLKTNLDQQQHDLREADKDAGNTPAA